MLQADEIIFYNKLSIGTKPLILLFKLAQLAKFMLALI